MRRLLGLAAWFATLVPAITWMAGRDSTLRLVLSGGNSLLTTPVHAPLLGRVSWILAGTLAATLPVMWTRSITARRRGWSQSAVQSLVAVPLLAAGVVLVVPHGAVISLALVSLLAAVRVGRSARRSTDVIALGVVTSAGISAARGQLAVGLAVCLSYCAVSLLCAWLDVARRPVRGLRRRWTSRAPSGARRARAALLRDGRVANRRAVAEDSDAAFRLAARAWRERLAIASSPSDPQRDPRFNAVLSIHSADGARVQARLERILRECTRRWELRACEPGEDGRTVLRYGIRVPRTSRGRLLDALQRSAIAEGVELR